MRSKCANTGEPNPSSLRLSQEKLYNKLMNIIPLLLLVIVIGVLAYGTIAKTKWGINFKGFFKAMMCPKCGTELPPVRLPSTHREMAWGGWVCAKCSTHVDKWGREIKSSS